MTSINRLFVSLLLFLVVVSGCGKSQTPSTVSGKVTYKGQPVPSGTISFHRTGEEQSGAYSFPLKSDGTYEGAGLVAEEMIVTIETESANPKRSMPAYNVRGGGGKNPMADYDKTMKERGFKAAASADPSQYVPIPTKYANRKTSPLKAPLTRGKNPLNFDLTD
jgi:hypothetical protein